MVMGVDEPGRRCRTAKKAPTKSGIITSRRAVDLRQLRSPASTFCRRLWAKARTIAIIASGNSTIITLAAYSSRVLGTCPDEAPLPPPGLCARLATATSASSAVRATPLSISLRTPLIGQPSDGHRLDRSFQTAERAEPARPEIDIASDVSLRGSLDKYGYRAPLGFEDRLLDVAEVFAVGLERKRTVAPDVNPVEVVPVMEICGAGLAAAGQDVGQQPRHVQGRDLCRRDDVQAELEARLGRDADGKRACVCVRVPVRDQREGRPAEALQLERRLEPAATARQEARRGADEGEVARPAPVRSPPELVHPPDELGVESDPRREPKAPAVGPPHGDPPRATLVQRLPQPASGGNRRAREAEPAGQDARAASRQEGHRHAGRQTVQDLVRGPVSAVDDD